MSITLPNCVELLTPEEAAQRLCMSPRTLGVMRYERKGPPSHKIGGSVFYRADELEAYKRGSMIMGSPKNAPAELLSTSQAEEYLDVEPGTLVRMRLASSGPAFIKLSKKRVFYHLKDLNEYRQCENRQEGVTE